MDATSSPSLPAFNFVKCNDKMQWFFHPGAPVARSPLGRGDVVGSRLRRSPNLLLPLTCYMVRWHPTIRHYIFYPTISQHYKMHFQWSYDQRAHGGSNVKEFHPTLSPGAHDERRKQDDIGRHQPFVTTCG